MYSIDNLWKILQLEFFLFGGVPETAVQMYERESHGHEEIRQTRQEVEEALVETEENEVFCTLKFDSTVNDYVLVEEKI